MTDSAARAYVRRWANTGRLLEEIRWRELRTLDDSTALRAADALIAAALQVPLPPSRNAWSGLVHFQRALARRRA